MLCSNEKCFGCYACANVCPVNAIAFQENESGAIVPVIQKEKCKNCHLCEKVCPAIQPPKGARPDKCFAAWSLDSKILATAASGGIVSSIYKCFLEQNGVVFGTEYRNGRLVFTHSETNDAINRYSGSKYIHAEVENAFREVKAFLRSDRKVVFAGTPCQIAGLKSYLGKEYENLFLIDIICHGVAPQKYLQEYAKAVCGTEYDKVLFRGEKGNRIAIYKDSDVVYCKDKWFDPYSMAYAKGLISRENCYACPFASLERQGDITVGDFWGLNKENLTIDASSIPFVSLILVNAPKGLEMLQDIEGTIAYEERSVSEAVDGNTQLTSPCKRHKDRTLFLKGYKLNGFVKALKSTSVYTETKKAEFIMRLKKPFRTIKRMMNGG